MKRKVTTTIGIIVIVLAIVLLGIVAFLYFIDDPVVEEGKEPTVAQKIILLGKKYLGELLGIFGVSGIAVMGFLTKWIYESSKKTLAQSVNTTEDVAGLKSDNVQLRAENREQKKLLLKLIKKQDIANNMLMTLFSLSDLPASVREQIYKAQGAYDEVDKINEIAEQVAESVINSAESEEQPVTEKTEPIKEQSDETASSPVYM